MVSISKAFQSIVSNYSRVFAYLYPCPEKNGFSEASLTTHFVHEIGIIEEFKNPVFWDEFPLPEGKRADSVVYSDFSKSIIIFEAKNLETSLSNISSMASDIARCYEVAANEKLFPERLWESAKNHSRHISKKDFENNISVYGCALGTFWLDSSSTVSAAKNEFLEKLRSNLSALPTKREILVKRINFQNPDIKEKLYFGCLFWLIKEAKQAIDQIVPVTVQPAKGKLSLDDFVRNNCSLAKVKSSGDKYTYLWPKAFSQEMPDTRSYRGNNLQCWIDYKSGGKIVLVVAHKTKTLSYKLPASSWTNLTVSNPWGCPLGAVASAFGFELGDSSDLDDPTRAQKIKDRMITAITEMSNFSF